jgi:hypothetical protein
MVGAPLIAAIARAAAGATRIDGVFIPPVVNEVSRDPAVRYAEHGDLWPRMREAIRQVFAEREARRASDALAGAIGATVRNHQR